MFERKYIIQFFRYLPPTKRRLRRKMNWIDVLWLFILIPSILFLFFSYTILISDNNKIISPIRPLYEDNPDILIYFTVAIFVIVSILSFFNNYAIRFENYKKIEDQISSWYDILSPDQLDMLNQIKNSKIWTIVTTINRSNDLSTTAEAIEKLQNNFTILVDKWYISPTYFGSTLLAVSTTYRGNIYLHLIKEAEKRQTTIGLW